MLPDELLERFVVDAAQFPEEFSIMHPDSALDPLFFDLMARGSVLNELQVQWNEVVVTRSKISRVSRRFRRIVTPFLYSSLFADNRKCLEKFSTAVQDNPALGTFLRRLFIGPLGRSSFELAKNLVTMCPNIMILDSRVQINLEYLPTTLRSLDLVHHFKDHTHTYKSAVASQFSRLHNLERLALRLSSMPPGLDFNGIDDDPLPDLPFLPLLRTAALIGVVPDTILKGVIHPAAPIKNLCINNYSSPRTYFPQLSQRTKNLTHLSVPYHWLKQIPINDSLRHLHIEAILVGYSALDDIVPNIKSIVSLSLKFGTTGFDSAMKWMSYITKWVTQHQGAPNLRQIHTDRGFQHNLTEKRKLSRIRTFLEVLEASGVQWLTQFRFVVTPMREILAEKGA